MLGNLIGPEIKQLIEARDFAALRSAFADWAPADVAECITDLPEQEQAVVFRLLPTAQAAEVLEYLEHEAQQTVLKAMGSMEAARVLNDMSADDRTALLEELPGAAVVQLLQLLSPEEKAIAQTLLNYPEDSVGRWMTPEFVSVRGEWTVQQVLAHIRQNATRAETIHVLYITDERGRLIDDIRIAQILLAAPEARIDELRDDTFIALRAVDPASTAIDVFKKYDRTTLPVIDSEEKLLGIVTVDDILDLQEEETTEDMQKIGGVEALEEPYMEAPLLDLVKKRAVWLVVLFVGQMLTATVMGAFEAEIAKAVVLALFIPLIISSGGNSGSQAATLVIRAMALGEITLADWWRVMKREIVCGLFLGGLLGAIGFLRITIWSKFTDSYGPHPLLVGLTVAVAVLGVTLWGTLSGSMLPIFLRRCGLDPATSSAPFVATLVDVTGLVIYFTTALLLLRGTLL